MSIQEFDNLSEKRIYELIQIQQKRLEEKQRKAEAERKEQERLAARNKITRR